MINYLQKVVVMVTVLTHSLMCPSQLLAQLKITYPISRMVLQRNSSNQATVQIAGSYSQLIDVVDARAVVRVAGQGTTTAWSTIQTNPTNGQFNGTINVTGGWYEIQVRGWNNGSLVASDVVDRFGVGEVFAIIGHSNAQGSSCIINGVDNCPTIEGATDDRVNVIAIDHSTTTFQQNYLPTGDTRYLPGLAFSKLLIHSGASPFAQDAWLWGHMGDELVSRINVPILLYNAGFGGTSMQYTYWAAYDIPFVHSFVRYNIRMPFVNLRNLMNLYVPTTGIRAVLIQHGENDRENPSDSTYKYYYKVIDKMRTEFNKPDLGCIVALSSYVGARFDGVRLAQSRVINRANYNVFQGPDLDNINQIADRPDGIHFSPSGQVLAGNYWAIAINNVWSLITPYAALPQPVANLACAGSNQLTLTQPAGYQYNWDAGSTGQSVTVGAGTYGARLKDGQNRIFFPPAVVVPSNVQPAPPTITTDNGTWNICRSTGLRLTSSYNGLNNWSTGVTSSSINVTAPGVYSVQGKNPVYGCLSSVVTQSIGWSPVDLGLLIQATRRVVAVNDTVSFRLLVQNKSGCDAGSITLLSRLPPNMSVISTGNTMTAANNIVSSTIPTITAGATISQQYTARLLASGTYHTTAELTASLNPDLNATPNNGTANGEDDEALADLRTTDYSATVYESPNPNQGTLPSVQLNQPMPNPAKSDLSLQMQFSHQAVMVDQLIDIKLIVKNEGGLAATNVVVSNVLPVGTQFVSSTSGMSGNGAIISGTISQIPVGQTVSLTFTIKVTGNGVLTNQAQIMSADQSDPDSVPGNGYVNGEDDQASVTLRTSG